MSRTRTMETHLANLWASEASREHLLKDGMRVLTAAEVAYLWNFRNYRSAYGLEIPRTPRGWLAKEVKRALEGGVKPNASSKPTRACARARASATQPWWGGDAA